MKLLSYIVYPLQFIWRTLFFVNALLTFFLFYPFFFVFLSSRKWFPRVFKLKKVWGNLMMLPLGIFYRVHRKSKLDKNRAYVFCPNHTSYLDIFLIYVTIPNYFHTMGKAELKKLPLFSKFFDRMNIPVNRKSRVDSHRAFLRAAEDIDKGISVSLFPEGTISRTAPAMGRFKNGPFRLAIEKQVPVVPISFVDNWILLPDNFPKKLGRPGVAHVIFHDPIETKGMTEADIDTLKEKVFEIISAPVHKKYPQHFHNTNS